MATSDLVGKTLDRYRILRIIGSGGMGSVYLAEHTKIGKQVAVKVLHPHLAESYPQSTQRMLNEARAAATIGHPGIVDVTDYGDTDDGYHYIVMELLNGGSLADLLQRTPVLPVGAALGLMDQILAALHAAHSKGIVHRDLKPDNVFVHQTSDGQWIVKLLDFGISKFTLDRSARLTATGAVMGTPYYMSMEQAEGRTDVDFRTDLYSAGVILYECLSGALPFSGENPNQVIVSILRNEPPPLSALRPDLPAGILDVVSKATDRRREGRFQSADAFRAALAPYWNPDDPVIASTVRPIVPRDIAPRLRPSALPPTAAGPLPPTPSAPAAPVTTPNPPPPATAAGPLPPTASAPAVPATTPDPPPPTTAPIHPADLAMAQTMMPSTTQAPIADAIVSANPAVTNPLRSRPGTPSRRREASSGLTRMKRFIIIWVLVVAALALVGIVSVKACSGSHQTTTEKAVKKAVKKAKNTAHKKKRRRHRSPGIIRRIRSIL